MTNNLHVALAETRQADISRQAIRPSRHGLSARGARPTRRGISTLIAETAKRINIARPEITAHWRY